MAQSCADEGPGVICICTSTRCPLTSSACLPALILSLSLLSSFRDGLGAACLTPFECSLISSVSC